jgi:tyrosyl-tRNA synthetase
MAANNILEELRWRGLVYDVTEGIEELVTTQKVTLYNGFDPTADSLHIGNLVPMMQLARWQRFGHHPIALAGGGTGLIGDPSGRSSERTLMSKEMVDANLAAIKEQLAGVLDFEVKTNPARIVNNADWLFELSLLEFLRDIAKHFTVNYMIAKDSVKSRLEREDGISFTEFSYMLLQSYDFLHLFDHCQCIGQTGGSDQWGNILAGVELIRKMRGQRAFGLVYPLITRADGSKFGKTAEGESVWLSPQRTSPYRFYQFWFNTDDGDVIPYLKFFTWLEKREIQELEEAVFQQPEKREAQRRLAREVTRMIHGPTALARSEQASQVLFGGDISGLDAGDIADIFADVPSSQVSKADLEGEGLSAVDLLAIAGLASSKGDARRSIQGGGIYLNNERVSNPEQRVTLAHSVEGQFLLLRKGRRQYHLVRILE